MSSQDLCSVYIAGVMMHSERLSHAIHAERCLAMQEQRLMPSLSSSALRANWRPTQVSSLSTNTVFAHYIAAAHAHCGCAY